MTHGLNKKRYISNRHLVIPDMQVRPGVPLDHIDWVAAAIVDYRPNTVVELGDFWDFPSLNSHSDLEELEGKRFEADVEAGNRAFARLSLPMEKEERRLKGAWKPVKKKLKGNHEERPERVVAEQPRLKGVISSDWCDTRDWEWCDFLERQEIDGLTYNHYFPAAHSGNPIGGTITNRLGKIGGSFVQGHEQGFAYGCQIMGNGKTYHGLKAGSCYLHREAYRGNANQRHWQGIVVLNDVRDGEYDIMPLSLKYLCERYEGISLISFMEKKYPKERWDHLR